MPFFSCPTSLPASESFPMSQPFPWGGQSTGVSALTSFLPNNSQGWSPLGWTGWIALQSKELSRVFSNTTVKKHQFFGAQLSSQSSSTGKTIALARWTFVGKVMSLFFNFVSGSVLILLPRSKCLNFMTAVTICSDFGAPKNKVWHCFHWNSFHCFTMKVWICFRCFTILGTNYKVNA